jgi:hypothetical protein
MLPDPGRKNRGPGICEYPGAEGGGPIYSEGEDQGEHLVGVGLYASQYRQDYELWVCLKGWKEDKYIKIGQNICSRIESKILLRTS